MNRLIIWGAGELGGRVARLWLNSGGSVIGLTQSPKRHALLKAMGVEPLLGSPTILQPEDIFLMAIPGHARQHGAIQTLINSKTPQPVRAVYISSTGYYGLAHGSITEGSPPGQDERSAKIAAAEQMFRAWAGPGGVILRFGGLYCSGRGPLSALARRGTPRIRPPDKTLALIHYDDAASATYASLRHPTPKPTYLGVTPPCPTRQEFYQRACLLLKLPEPGFAPPLGQKPAQYDVTQLRRDLLPNPAHPDWRDALIP